VALLPGDLAARVNDNTFWLFNTLLGLTTKGTFKTHTLRQSMVAVISPVLILAVSLVA
jgi:GntP family gluconate:H+ symporter